MSLRKSVRELLDELAKSKGFHPTEEPHRWYDITYEDTLQVEV